MLKPSGSHLLGTITFTFVCIFHKQARRSSSTKVTLTTAMEGTSEDARDELYGKLKPSCFYDMQENRC
ncbi:Hypothetical predicted protein [Podarcis lilfordi]|uniref:Uncharacterized protein n=1 Tax=Podarcis lilfordi TaxID=74358 RepID=A0AA35KKZ8_9SAUR|nr:Hypothetical predicted protein [Podarcis lilfordi]